MVKRASVPRSIEIPRQVLAACVQELRASGAVVGRSEADFLVVQRMLDLALSALLDERRNFLKRSTKRKIPGGS